MTTPTALTSSQYLQKSFRLLHWALWLCLFSFPGTAWAQTSAWDVPMGGRSTLMGRTGTALGRDGAAPFQNPATLGRLNGDRIAFSAAFFSVQNIYLPNWYRPDGTGDGSQDASINRQSIRDMPSTLCLFFGLGSMADPDKTPPKTYAERRALARKPGHRALGLCAGNSEINDFGLTARNYITTLADGTTSTQHYNIMRTWNRYQIGPTYSYRATEDLSFGVSLMGVVSTLNSIWDINQSNTYQSQLIDSNSYSQGTYAVSVDVAATIGATYEYKNLTLAIALGLPSITAFGEVTGNVDYSHNQNSVSTGATGAFSAPLPLRIRLGTGIEFPWGNFEWNTNITLFNSNAFQSYSEDDALAVQNGQVSSLRLSENLNNSRLAVVNFALGAEYKVIPGLSALFGGGTDISIVPEVSTQISYANFSQERTTRIYGSAGFAADALGPELLFGTELSAAWGEVLGANFTDTIDLVSTPYRNFQLLFIVGGNMDFKAVDKALGSTSGIGHVGL